MHRPDGPESGIEHSVAELFEGLRQLFQRTRRDTLQVSGLRLTFEGDTCKVGVGDETWIYANTKDGLYRLQQRGRAASRALVPQDELKELLTILYRRAATTAEARQHDQAQSPFLAGDFFNMEEGALQIWADSLQILLGQETAPSNLKYFVGIDKRQSSPARQPTVLPPAPSPEDALTVRMSRSTPAPVDPNPTRVATPRAASPWTPPRPAPKPAAPAPADPFSLAPHPDDGARTAFYKQAAAVGKDAEKVAEGERRKRDAAEARRVDAERRASIEADRRRAAEKAAEEAHGNAGAWRQLFNAGLVAAGLGIATLTVGAGVVITHPEEVRSILGINENKLVRPLSTMKLPEGISDTGAMLLAAAPVEQGKFYEDSLLDRYGLKSALFDDKFLIMGAEDIDYGGKTRGYQFSVPSADNGEQDKGETNASFADAINLLLRNDLTDDNLKDWIVYWFRNAYTDQAGAPIKLERDKIIIERDDQKKVSKVLYAGANKDAKVRYEKVRYEEKTRKTSVTARRTTTQQPRNFVGSDGELLLFTGGTLNQQLLVPEVLLKPDGFGDLKAHGKDFEFTWKELAAGVRQYFEIKNKTELKAFTDLDGRPSTVDTWNRYTTPRDPILLRIVSEITEGKKGEKRFEAVRKALQDTPYVRESRRTEANRPPVATLLKEGGDCNNQAVKAASYLEAAGYDAALLYAMRSDAEAKAAEAKGDAFAYSTHVLVGVDEADLGFDAPADAVKYTDATGTVWVVLETNGDHKLGAMPLTDFHVVLADEVH